MRYVPPPQVKLTTTLVEAEAPVIRPYGPCTGCVTVLGHWDWLKNKYIFKPAIIRPPIYIYVYKTSHTHVNIYTCTRVINIAVGYIYILLLYYISRCNDEIRYTARSHRSNLHNIFYAAAYLRYRYSVGIPNPIYIYIYTFIHNIMTTIRGIFRPAHHRHTTSKD